MNGLKLSLLMLALVLLSACDIIVTPISGVTVRNGSYSTNYEASIDGVKRYIICENRTTELAYGFDYNGNLMSWTSYLKGVNSGQIKGSASFTEADIVSLGRAEAVYTIPPGTAPLMDEAELRPQGIVVVPNPDIIGYTRLYVTVNGLASEIRLDSSSIPVVNPCP